MKQLLGAPSSSPPSRRVRPSFQKEFFKKSCMRRRRFFLAR
ncbi:unnamed protein product [Amoebophrya sp. A25]|nr:unnamed protein product [Amoebophrya sp. A25]|eukprot:GSA25T00027756001.1